MFVSDSTRQHLCYDVIDIDVTENDVIDSWMNMHTLLASRPNVIASMRVDARRRAWCERGFSLSTNVYRYVGYKPLLARRSRPRRSCICGVRR